VNDANTEYLNEMRYKTIEQQSGYEKGEFYITRGKIDLIYPKTFFCMLLSVWLRIVSDIIFIIIQIITYNWDIFTKIHHKNNLTDKT